MTRLVEQSVALARELGMGYVATNNVHYATRDRHRLQDVLVCIRHHTTLEQAGPLRRANSEYYLKSAEKMTPPVRPPIPTPSPTRASLPSAASSSRATACRTCPRFGVPAGLDAPAYLRRLCEDALPHRYPDTSAAVAGAAGARVGHHHAGGLANYFLIVWDIVRFARAQGIRCQGRGSAANSLVAYLLGITPIDPLAHDLVFERFLSDERRLAPDIDIDFQADRREEVIQYVYQTYGRDHAAMACTLVTFRAERGPRGGQGARPAAERPSSRAGG